MGGLAVIAVLLAIIVITIIVYNTERDDIPIMNKDEIDMLKDESVKPTNFVVVINNGKLNHPTTDQNIEVYSMQGSEHFFILGEEPGGGKGRVGFSAQTKSLQELPADIRRRVESMDRVRRVTAGASLSPSNPSNKAEQLIRNAKKLGVIDKMPDDPEAMMEKVHTLTRLGDEWAESIRSKQGVIDDDGIPLFDKVYLLAIEHYVKGNGYSLSHSDKQSVTEAAQHFDKYWRSKGKFPQDKSGAPNWWEIYGMIQDHFRKWTKG